MVRSASALIFLGLLTTVLFASCDEGLKQCRLPCERDEECQGSGFVLSRCVNQRCFFVGCEQDGDCNEGEGCVELLGARVCVELCAADDDCFIEYESCFQSVDGRGICSMDCRKAGCIEEAECDQDSGQCYCEADEACFGGVCEVPS